MRKQGLKNIASVLLTATILTSVSTGASADGDDLESRVERLESLLEKILDRMERQDAKLTEQETEIVTQAARITQQETTIADTRSAVGSGGGSDGFRMGDTTVKLGGFVKLDVNYTKYSDGALAPVNFGRDFYIPALIPVGGAKGDAHTDFNARETRFFIKTSTPVAGHTLGTTIEMDFQVTGDGDERTTNGYNPRLRHAFITYDNWLMGQTWSTFQDVAALPDNLDFIGPAESTVFIRQPMIRYSNGPWQIAIEQPETTLTSGAGGRVVSGEDKVPDVIARYTHKGDFGHVSLAGIFRVLNMEDNLFAGIAQDSATGYGAALSGKLKVGGKDDFRFMGTYGEGLGRYIGLNTVNAAAIDAAGNLDPIATYSGFASFRHFWTDQARSNVTFGYFKADNPVVYTGNAVTDEVWSTHVNLIYSPVPKLDFGVEYIFAKRSLENGMSGNMNRVQFSSKYAF